MTWRVAVLVAVLFGGLYLILPSFVFREGVSEEARGPVVQFLAHVLPERGLNLGLDLRGGVYLELEVELDTAIRRRLEIMARESARRLEEEKQVSPTFEVEALGDAEGYRLIAALAPDADVEGFRSRFDEQVKAVWEYEGGEGTAISYRLSAEYETELRNQVISQAIESVRNRVDRFGVAEAGIRRHGSGRIVVELPGIKDTKRVIDVIRQTGELTFKLSSDAVDEGALRLLVDEARKTAALSGDAYDQNAVQQLNAALAGKIPEGTELAFSLNRDRVTKRVVGATPHLLLKPAELTGELLENARVAVHNNEPYVALSFNTAGARRFGDLTEKHVGEKLAILLDGNVVTAPVIQEAIQGGEAQITLGIGNYADILREAEDLALVLREGALPAALRIENQNIVGPSLGADSVHKGVIATLMGGALVLIFMALYYKTSGVVADLSLIFNLVILLGALAFFGASLTLPGIAGIALTVGMAVDGNVIIFERIKDELKTGVPVKAAFERGYAQALSAVMDSNITTFIAGVVLFQFGTGPIKGFATTLMIGIASTLVSVLWFSRWIQEMALEGNKWSAIRI